MVYLYFIFPIIMIIKYIKVIKNNMFDITLLSTYLIYLFKVNNFSVN